MLSHSIIVLAFPPFLSFSFPLLCRGKNPFSILPPRPLKRGRCLHHTTHVVKPIEEAGPLLEFISHNASTRTSPAPFYTFAYAASPFRNTVYFPPSVSKRPFSLTGNRGSDSIVVFQFLWRFFMDSLRPPFQGEPTPRLRRKQVGRREGPLSARTKNPFGIWAAAKMLNQPIFFI